MIRCGKFGKGFVSKIQAPHEFYSWDFKGNELGTFFLVFLNEGKTVSAGKHHISDVPPGVCALPGGEVGGLRPAPVCLGNLRNLFRFKGEKKWPFRKERRLS